MTGDLLNHFMLDLNFLGTRSKYDKGGIMAKKNISHNLSLVHAYRGTK